MRLAEIMSDVSQGPGWWQAADGKWYPPAPQQQPVNYAPVGPKNDGMSIAGLVCGISGLTLIGCGIGLIPAILGVVFGIIGIKKIDASNGTIKGRGMALAGAICGAIAIGLFVLYIVIVIINAIASSN
jgi:hypothetical protein